MPWPESSAAMASGCFMETVYLSSASYFIPACSAAICSTRACIEVLTDGRPILVPGPMSLSDLIFGSRNTRTAGIVARLDIPWMPTDGLVSDQSVDSGPEPYAPQPMLPEISASFTVAPPPHLIRNDGVVGKGGSVR